MRLLGACSLYSKTLLSVIYDCGPVPLRHATLSE